MCLLATPHTKTQTNKREEMSNSAAAMQEIEYYSQSFAVLESSTLSKAEREAKLQPLKQRLKSKVSIEQASQLLELATKRYVDDDKRACERALQALVDFLPQDQVFALVKQGLRSGVDSSTKTASLDKLAGMEETDEVLELLCAAVSDADTKVALKACAVLKTRQNKAKMNALLKQELELNRQQFDVWSVTALRIWDLAAQDLAHFAALLESMFQCLEQVNDDVLFVLNLLEIAASLPREFHFQQANTAQVERTLLHYAQHEDLVSNDALRVLAGLHFHVLNENCEALLQVLHERMTVNRELTALEVVGMFLGANQACFDFVLQKNHALFTAWVEQCMKHCHGGNDGPRSVALDAFARAMRGGMENAQFSTRVYEQIKPVLPTLLKYVTSAVKSLHPQVQLGGFQLARVLVSQDASWGVSIVFHEMPNEVWFANEMPSPNANQDAREARYQALLHSKVQFLDREADEKLLQQIARAIKLGPRQQREHATVEVAAMGGN